MEVVMYGVLRSYSGDGAKKLASLLEERKAEVEAVIRGVPGLISWGLISVTIARDWIKKNASDISAPAPTITEGPVSMRVST